MRDCGDITKSFELIPEVVVTDTDERGTGLEVEIKRLNITAKFFVPKFGEQAQVVRIMAKGGRKTGGGEGRRLLDDVVTVLDEMGFSNLGVVDGSEFWNKQSDFRKIENGVKITHIKEW